MDSTLPIKYPSDEFHNIIINSMRKNPRVVEFESGFFYDRRGLKIFYRGWRLPNGSQNNSPHISIKVGLHIHGMSSHSEPYICIADGLLSDNDMLYAIDLIGHGNSEGIRGDYEDFKSFVENVEDGFQFLYEKYPNAAFFLSGDSMGALALTLYLLTLYKEENNILIHKVIYWGPAFAPNLDEGFTRDFWLTISLGIKLLINPDEISHLINHTKTFRDALTLHYHNTDKKMLTRCSPRYLWKMTEAMIELEELNEENLVPVSFCIIQGEKDYIVSKYAAKDFYDHNLPNFQGIHEIKPKFILVKDCWHNIYNDPAFGNEYWQQIRSFLNQPEF